MTDDDDIRLECPDCDENFYMSKGYLCEECGDYFCSVECRNLHDCGEKYD